MRFEQYINEMGASMQLDNGIDISKSAMGKFKRKFKDNIDGFIKHIETKYKLSDEDIRKLKVAYEEI